MVFDVMVHFKLRITIVMFLLVAQFLFCQEIVVTFGSKGRKVMGIMLSLRRQRVHFYPGESDTPIRRVVQGSNPSLCLLMRLLGRQHRD